MGKDPFRGIPLSRSLLQERKRGKKGKGYEIERRGVPFLTRSLWQRRSVVRFSCQRRRLSRRRVNATGRVVGGAAVVRARAVRGTTVSLCVFESRVRSGRNIWTGLALVFIYSGEGLAMVLCSASCLPLRFSQPERLSQRKGNCPPCPLRRHPFRSVMADRVTIISPRDPWPFSMVTATDLEDLVGEGLLRPLTDEQRPEWIPPAGGAAPSPPPGYIVSFVSFHERGFGVPTSRFMRAILHHYGVELHNLSPNSISQAAIFVAVCEGYMGIAPHWDLWTHLFFAELFASPTGERKVHAAVRAGGCTLLLRQSRASLYIPAILASSNKGWQCRWFYLRNDGELLPPFSQRVITTAADAWRHGTPHERQKNLEPLLKALEALRKGGLTAAGVIAAIHRRRVLPLAECHTQVSGHQDPGANIITRCAGTKSHTYDESWHRIECHNFTT
jgi:hypothetical protein